MLPVSVLKVSVEAYVRVCRCVKGGLTTVWVYFHDPLHLWGSVLWPNSYLHRGRTSEPAESCLVVWGGGRDVTTEEPLCSSLGTPTAPQKHSQSLPLSKASEYEFPGLDTVQIMPCWALMNGKWHLQGSKLGCSKWMALKVKNEFKDYSSHEFGRCWSLCNGHVDVLREGWREVGTIWGSTAFIRNRSAHSFTLPTILPWRKHSLSGALN